MTAPAVEIGDDDHRGIVYFIEDASSGLIKIGYTTDLPKRFQDLRTGSSAELAILLHFRADRAVELAIHRHLSSCRVRGEWFANEEQAQDVMDEISDFLLQFDGEDENRHVMTFLEFASILASPEFGLTDADLHEVEKQNSGEKPNGPIDPE